MSPRTPSASSVYRALHCPASCVLQEVGLIVGDAARFGTEGHSFLERVPQIGAEKALELAPEDDRAFFATIPLDRLPVRPGQAQQEVAFAIDLASGKAVKVGESIGRAYPQVFAAGDQINATADVVSQLGPGKGYVADYKFGAESNVPDPADNPQLLTLALAAAKVFGWTEVVLELHFIREGFVWTKTATVGVLELDAHLALLRRMAKSIAEMDPDHPDMSEGPWCTWCSSFSVCPAKAKLASAMVVGDNPHLTLRLDAMTLPIIWDRVEQAQAILNSVKAACQGFAQASPVELSDGRIFGAHETSQERVTDGGKVWEYLLGKYGSEVAELGTERHASKTSLEDALRGPVAEAKARGDRTSLAAAMRTAVGALREKGAIEDVTSVKVEPYWPRK